MLVLTVSVVQHMLQELSELEEKTNIIMKQSSYLCMIEHYEEAASTILTICIINNYYKIYHYSVNSVFRITPL